MDFVCEWVWACMSVAFTLCEKLTVIYICSVCSQPLAHTNENAAVLAWILLIVRSLCYDEWHTHMKASIQLCVSNALDCVQFCFWTNGSQIRSPSIYTILMYDFLRRAQNPKCKHTESHIEIFSRKHHSTAKTCGIQSTKLHQFWFYLKKRKKTEWLNKNSKNRQNKIRF